MKLTNDEVINRFKKYNLKIIGEYVNTTVKVLVECSNGHLFSIKPNDVFNGHGCAACKGVKKLTLVEVKDRLLKKNIEILGDYSNSQTKTSFKCLMCENIWETTPSTVFNNGCAACYGNKKLTEEIVLDNIKDMNVTLIGDYLGLYKKTVFQCDSCGYHRNIKPSSLLYKKSKCPNCKGNRKLEDSEINKRLENRNILIVNKGKNSGEKYTFKCLNETCNHRWDALIHSVINGKLCGCPNCSVGKSEKRIFNIIKKYCSYENMYIHKMIKYNGRKLYPDFTIINNNVTYFIEYNGKQHYMPIRFGGISETDANIKFAKQIERDNLLDEYCKINRIILITIPYFSSDEERVLDILKANSLII